MTIIQAQGAYCRYCRDSRERVEELEEEVRQLRVLAFGDTLRIPPEWRLSPTEGILIKLLVKHELVNIAIYESAMLSKNPLWSAEDKIFDVYICKVRKKLARFGVQIVTTWGLGYSLAPGQRALVKAACEGGSHIIGDCEAPLVERPRGGESLRQQVLRAIDDYPHGTHVTELQRRFPDFTGLSSTLKSLADNGEIKRTLYGSRREGFTYYPLKSSAPVPAKEGV